MHTNAIKEKSVEVQQAMRSSLQSQKYIDLGATLCGPAALRCRLFTDTGAPLSFDGNHLSRAGAKYLGDSLAAAKSVEVLSQPFARQAPAAVVAQQTER
jgi:SGNH domain (fused to AT3 domains)